VNAFKVSYNDIITFINGGVWMIIIGEKINSSLKAVKPLIESNDKFAIQEIAKNQYDMGAEYIDINTSSFQENEALMLEWLVNTIQEVSEVPFSISSLNPSAIERVLKINRNSKPIINSLSDQEESIITLLPIISEYKTRVIALCMDDSGMPETVDERLSIADRLINKLTSKGIKADDIFIDPVVRPVGTNSKYGVIALDAIRSIKKNYPGVHIICDLANISFGIPARKLMNEAFLIAAMTAGMDGVILDPLDSKIMALLYAGDALLGTDDFCMNYMMKFREGLLEK